MDDLETLSDVNDVLANEISDMIREFEAKDFEITYLREKLKAAQLFIELAIQGWEYTLPSEGYRLPIEAARDCLIKIKTAL